MLRAETFTLVLSEIWERGTLRKTLMVVMLGLFAFSLFAMFKLQVKAQTGPLWKDDFNYGTLSEMKSAGWLLSNETMISVGGGTLTLDNNATLGCSAQWASFPIGVYDYKIETRVMWTARSFGSINLHVKTERHSYTWSGDDYHLNFVYQKDAEPEVRFGYYSPTKNTWMSFVFEKNGTNINLYWKGTLITTVTETDPKSGLTQVGISPGWTSTDKIDYISVTSLHAGVVYFTVKPNPFSPNGDGRKDTTTVKATFSRTTTWILQIRNTTGFTVRSWTGTSTSLSRLWDGKDNAGKVVPNGSYYAYLSGIDAEGRLLKPRVLKVVVDTIAPEIKTLASSPNPFNPYIGQTTTISYWLSEECIVTIRIYNSTGNLKRKLIEGWDQPPGPHSIAWDGRDDQGNILPTGPYRIKVYVRDIAGNNATTYPKTITVSIAI